MYTFSSKKVIEIVFSSVLGTLTKHLPLQSHTHTPTHTKSCNNLNGQKCEYEREY